MRNVCRCDAMYMQRKALVRSPRSLDIARDSRVYFLDAPTILCVFLASIMLSILSSRLLAQHPLQYQLKRSVMCIFLVLHFVCLFTSCIFCSWFHFYSLPLIRFIFFVSSCLFSLIVYMFHKYIVPRFLSRIITLNGQYIVYRWYSTIPIPHTFAQKIVKLGMRVKGTKKPSFLESSCR